MSPEPNDRHAALIPRALRPQRSVERIVQEAQAIHWWVNEQIEKGRTDAEIEAMAPVALAFINGDLSLAELRQRVEEAERNV